ncbi:transcriptional regulator, MarR family [Oceaniovalibus guishaninsula JLT2003]|uniref:Transcriptional regulator, MarR family n=1 Tax=Oceaniovalibus guishaninsula JLT2003 TaxID=1231392 RepID=K2H6I4_9RHOB|nr:MarR family transcriptional regulator [Oceaniovalibus guishaninsula]EKE43233.1 transcriptional regulator, MarR family [Oceaniovalibus guishaninsula JLT2003]
MNRDLHARRSAFNDVSRMRSMLFDRMIAPHGITMSQAWLLTQLFIEDDLTQSELAQRMHVGTVAVGGTLNRLEAQGLVERRTDSVDKRAKRVRLTPAAVPVGRAMARCEREINRITYGDIDEGELDAMFATLFRIRENLRAALDAGGADRAVSAPAAS